MKNFYQLKKLINNYRISQNNNSYKLLDNAFSSDDIFAGIKVLLSRQITMSKITEKFEKQFAKFVGAKFAIMVNSGSSANLLAVNASCNPLRNIKFYPGDEAIIPALCWSTSLWPLVQFGLKTVFVDIDQRTLNVDVEQLIKKINSKTKLIMMVHVLGYSSNVEKIRNICRKKKIILIEDTCESLGSKFNNKYLGTFGDFGTYSFYYSHQITCGEGGMVVCNSYNDYKLLYALRAHGWARGPNQLKKNSAVLKRLDSRFVFINSGFNLRPTDLAASIASSQLNRLDYFIKIRNQNRNKIIKRLTSSKKWKNQFIFLEKVKNLKPSWFGLPILINKRYQRIKIKFTRYLEKAGVENRPIISGNFLNQPSAKLYKLNDKNHQFPNADEVEDRGFFIGLHTKPINKKQLDLLEKHLFNIDEFIKVNSNNY